MVLVPESRVSDFPTRAHAFQVIANMKALMVYADTMEERERWVEALDQEIQGLKERGLNRRSERNVRCERKGGRRTEKKQARKKAAQRPSVRCVLPCRPVGTPCVRAEEHAGSYALVRISGKDRGAHLFARATLLLFVPRHSCTM